MELRLIRRKEIIKKSCKFAFFSKIIDLFVSPFMRKRCKIILLKKASKKVANMSFFIYFFSLWIFGCMIKMNYAMSTKFNVLYHHSVNAEQGWEILLFLPSLHNYFNHFLLPFLAFDVIRNVFEFSS